MSAMCCVCRKKIGGAVEDYPLIPGLDGLRVCPTCHHHLKVIEQSCRKGEANPSVAYFNRLLVQDVNFEVRDRIQSAIKNYSVRVNDNIMNTSAENNEHNPLQRPHVTECECCGRRSDLYRMPVILEDGSNDVAQFCYHCYFKCKESEGIQTRTRGFVKEDTTTTIEPVTTGNAYSDSANSNVLSGWTSFAKVMNIIFIIACFIIGIVIGSSIGGGMYPYDEAEAVLGGIIGAIVGLVVGGAAIAISMVIIEISQNIQRMLVNSNKMLEIMEKNQNK